MITGTLKRLEIIKNVLCKLGSLLESECREGILCKQLFLLGSEYWAQTLGSEYWTEILCGSWMSGVRMSHLGNKNKHEYWTSSTPTENKINSNKPLVPAYIYVTTVTWHICYGQITSTNNE